MTSLLATARHLRREACLRKSGDTGARAETTASQLAVLVVAAISWPVLKTVFRHRAFGLENVPASGGFVLAANHWSNFDPWPLGIPLFPRRFLRFMAKSELFWFPLGNVITAGGAFRVRRGERDEEAIATAIGLCRRGTPW